MQPLDTVIARIDRLERECRRWRRGAVATAVLAVTVLMLGGAERHEVPRAIEAESFVLKDRSGNLKAVLGTWERNRATYLRFFEKGRRLDVGTEDGLSVVKLLDAEGRPSLRIEVTPKGAASILVRGAEGDATWRPIRPEDPAR